MNITAVDIAILPPEPLRGLAVEISKELNTGDFHLNTTDIFPHITLGIGFLEESSIEDFQYTISNITKHKRPFEAEAESFEGRYLMCKKSDQLFKLHRAICDAATFLHFEKLDGEKFDSAYVRRNGEGISQETKDYTNNFKWRNAYENFVPHITVGWDPSLPRLRNSKWKADLPVKFNIEEIFICQLGNKNTCRKVLYQLPIGNA